MASLLPLFLLIVSLLHTCSSTRTIKPTGLPISKRYVLFEDSNSGKPSSMVAFLGHPLWVGASIAFAVGFTLGTISFLLWRWALKHCTATESEPDCYDEPGNTMNATLFSPLIKCAEDLSFLHYLHHDHDGLPFSLEIIGRGGCGQVYKAELVTGDKRILIAIKMVIQPVAIDASHLSVEESALLSHRLRQIRAEIRTVGRMRHPNLLRLLAHVPQPDCHYLIYEFMKNGSLHDVLKSEDRELGWPARLKIALGIAAGLEYLHMVHRPRVIHRDLKPANILLDDNLNARIADFGLAKVVPDAVRISGTMSSRVAGTLGYIAPEYYQLLSCTDKCDVYSFGVILAVLVTGRFPNDGFLQTTEEMCLMGWVRRVMRSLNPSEAIDRALLGQGFEEQMLLVLKIACFCTYDDPNQRPNSRDVRCMLTQIKQ